MSALPCCRAANHRTWTPIQTISLGSPRSPSRWSSYNFCLLRCLLCRGAAGSASLSTCSRCSSSRYGCLFLFLNLLGSLLLVLLLYLGWRIDISCCTVLTVYSTTLSCLSNFFFFFHNKLFAFSEHRLFLIRYDDFLNCSSLSQKLIRVIFRFFHDTVKHLINFFSFTPCRPQHPFHTLDRI